MSPAVCEPQPHRDPKGEITILYSYKYTNDAHTFVDNVDKCVGMPWRLIYVHSGCSLEYTLHCTPSTPDIYLDLFRKHWMLNVPGTTSKINDCNISALFVVQRLSEHTIELSFFSTYAASDLRICKTSVYCVGPTITVTEKRPTMWVLQGVRKSKVLKVLFKDVTIWNMSKRKVGQKTSQKSSEVEAV